MIELPDVREITPPLTLRHKAEGYRVLYSASDLLSKQISAYL